MIHGHTIAGGFFVGLACDVRCGLNDSNLKIGITEIDVGVTFQSLTYLLIKTRMPGFARRILIEEPNRLYSPMEALSAGYLLDVAEDYQGLMDLSIRKALRVHPDSMDAYLSLKNYMFEQDIGKTWNEQWENALEEVVRVRNTAPSQRRMEAVIESLGRKRTSKL